MSRYVLTEAASRDVIEIYKQGVQYFGEAQADRYHNELHEAFSLLSSFPDIGKERPELSRPVRVHSREAHVIVYDVAPPGIRIVRVIHRSRDWQNLL